MLDRGTSRPVPPPSSLRGRSRRRETATPDHATAAISARSRRTFPRAQRRPQCQAPPPHARSHRASADRSDCSSSKRLRERSARSSAVDAAAVLGIDREHQPVEKTPPLGSGPEKQPVHFRHQPNHAQMIGEGRSRAHRLAVNACTPHGARARNRRIDPGAELRPSPSAPSTSAAHRPGAVALARAASSSVARRRPAAGRQKRNRLQEIGLAGAVGPSSTTGPSPISEFGAAVGAEIRRAAAARPRARLRGALFGGRFLRSAAHTRIGIST